MKRISIGGALSIFFAFCGLMPMSVNAAEGEEAQLSLVATCVTPSGEIDRQYPLVNPVSRPWIMNSVVNQDVPVFGANGGISTKTVSARLAINVRMTPYENGYLITGQGMCTGLASRTGDIRSLEPVGFSGNISGKGVLGGEPVEVGNQGGWRLLLQLQPITIISPK